MVNDFTISLELDLKIGNKSSLFLHKIKVYIRYLTKYV